MDLPDARALAGRFIELIAPYCERVLVVGSIRRKRAEVHDVDVVASPRMDEKEGWFGPERKNALEQRIENLILAGKIHPRVKKDGKTMVGHGVAFVEFEGVPVDVYYCPSPDHWFGLVQVRTGSAAFNQMLATRALHQGKRLHADGTGIWDADNEHRLDDGASEESIFKALEMRFYRPDEREIPLSEE